MMPNLITIKPRIRSDTLNRNSIIKFSHYLTVIIELIMLSELVHGVLKQVYTSILYREEENECE